MSEHEAAVVPVSTGAKALLELVDQIARYGPRATLVTVSPQATPKVGTVLVTAHEDGLAARVGRGTRANLDDNPAVCLMWTRDDDDYQLIVDGSVTVAGEAAADGLADVTVT